MGSQVMIQVLGVAITIVWSAVVALIAMPIVKAVFGGARVSESAESDGLDTLEPRRARLQRLITTHFLPPPHGRLRAPVFFVDTVGCGWPACLDAAVPARRRPRKDWRIPVSGFNVNCLPSRPRAVDAHADRQRVGPTARGRIA
jgi:hypothetical protein